MVTPRAVNKYMFRINIIRTCVVMLVMVFSFEVAIAGDGSCVNKSFDYKTKDLIDRVQPVTVIKQDAPIFLKSTGLAFHTTELYGVKRNKLNFNEKLAVLRESKERLEVTEVGKDRVVGWVNKGDLLCSLQPVIGKNGIEKKLYIKTATAIQGNTKPVNAFSSPLQKKCPSEGCRKLGRFTGYFIFDEQNNRYLLANAHNFKKTSSLVGWVDKRSGIVWDTAYGIRPHENLKSDEYVCAFENIAKDNKSGNCATVLVGGDQWFTYKHRIPVLGKVDNYYKVAFPVSAMGKDLQGAGKNQKKAFGDKKVDMEDMKKVDIFFLIDGTKSVRPYIPKIQDVVNKVVGELSNSLAFKETKFRFGFRIYRDAYAGNQGIGEGLPLSKQCDRSNVNSIEKGKQEFFQEINKVRSVSDANDDYEENLYGGIKQAVKDIKGCSQHTKLLFIIGDHGYSASAQKKHGNTVIGEKAIIRMLSGDKSNGVKTIVTFFIQTPNEKSGAKSPSAYSKAYSAFRKQGKYILGNILGSSENSVLDNYMLVASDKELVSKVFNGVTSFSRSDVVNELSLDLQGGASLAEAIQRLRKSPQFNSLPGLYWDNMINGNCSKLGKQCANKIYETIFEGFIPINDKIVEDVWLKVGELEKWRNILKNFSLNSNLVGYEQRKAFGNGLIVGLRSVIKGFYYNNQPIGEFIEKRRTGLPINDNSPLMKYSYDMLMDERVVSDCEISRLTQWMNASNIMLSTVEKGTKKPVYKIAKPDTKCRRKDGSIPEIPYIPPPITEANLGPSDDYTIAFTFHDVRILWVPKKYLP